jgi:hypothetical protein
MIHAEYVGIGFGLVHHESFLLNLHGLGELLDSLHSLGRVERRSLGRINARRVSL